MTAVERLEKHKADNPYPLALRTEEAREIIAELERLRLVAQHDHEEWVKACEDAATKTLELHVLRERVKELEALVNSQAERIAQQSEALSLRAEVQPREADYLVW